MKQQMEVSISKHPDLDFFMGFFGGSEIPTKQDKFKPMIGCELIMVEEDGTEKKMNDYDLYVKKKGKTSLQIFEESFKELIKENINETHPYKKPEKLEVVISVSMTERRLDEVDIDNIIKAVLDCFNGLIYEDDSQIVNVLAQKDVNSFYPVNGLMVGVRRLKEKKSWFEGVKLAYMEELKNEDQ